MATSDMTLKRRTIQLGAFSEFQLPKFPMLPKSLVLRDPAELVEYESKLEVYQQNLNNVLTAALAAKPAT